MVESGSSLLTSDLVDVGAALLTAAAAAVVVVAVVAAGGVVDGTLFPPFVDRSSCCGSSEAATG